MNSHNYTDANAATVDRWVEEGWAWGIPVSHETFLQAQEGEWEILLTPTRPVPASWWPRLDGADVLGLASGGGQQMPILTAAGALCTVLDYAASQLASERMVAEREGYDINIVQADMTYPLPFADASFDLVVNPVSLCYVREVEPIWREVFRVLRPGGVLLTGLDTGINFVVDEAEERIIHCLPFDPIEDPALMRELEEQDCGVQFSHTAGELLSGMLRAGLVIDDLYDDINEEGRLGALNIPSYLAVRAHRG